MGCCQSRDSHAWDLSEVTISAFLRDTQVANLPFELVQEQITRLTRGGVIPKGSVPIIPMLLGIKVTPQLTQLLSALSVGEPNTLSDRTTADLVTHKVLLFSALTCEGPVKQKHQLLYKVYDKSAGGYLTPDEVKVFLEDCLWIQLRLVPELTLKFVTDQNEKARLQAYSSALEQMMTHAMENFMSQLLSAEQIDFPTFSSAMLGKHLKLLLNGRDLRQFLFERLQRCLR